MTTRSPIVLGLVLAFLTLGSRCWAQPIHFDLCGTWQISGKGTAEADVLAATPIAVNVPGNVHIDLLAAGRIPDPFYRDNEMRLQWIQAATWTYTREFNLPAELLSHERLLLRCEGLDTVATIQLNGKKLAQTDNMFRTWEFDVRPYVHAGSNTIEITFRPIQNYIDEFVQAAPKIPNGSGRGMANIRKAAYSDGWDFAPKFPTCGIYRKIELLAFDTARITDVSIDQDLSDPKAAKLQIKTDVGASGAIDGLQAHATVALDGRQVASTQGPIGDLKLTIPNPQLWWPNGMGAHPLYEVRVELLGADRKPIDTATRRIGLRRVELLPKSADRPLRLTVNGREIFAKGINWVPADMFPTRVTPQKHRRFVADAVAVNMNFIRTWGGGYYEDDAFYDACDEMGLMVWSEFKFACTAYPGMNPAFADNVRAEVADQVRRLRHHPSIAVWSGNNECEGQFKSFGAVSKEQYNHMFHDIVGGKFKEEFSAAAANFVGGSPECGDDHNWWVWHMGANFEKYFESHGWMTEFGFQSFSNPDTTSSFTDPLDRVSVQTDVMKAHQHNRNGNQIILDQMSRYFAAPKDFESTLWLSQINQGYGMVTGIEHWRTDWPRSSGTFVWQYNDCAPVASWSAVDYYGRWKAAMYLFRRAYAPLLVSGKVDLKTKDVYVSIASDLATAANATLNWTLTDAKGVAIDRGRQDVQIPAGTTAVALAPLNMGAAVEKVGRRDAMLWLSLESGGKVASTKLLAFRRPKDLNLVDPQLSTEIQQAGDGFDVSVHAKYPALFVWLTCADPDARYSDNFVHLPADGIVRIHVTPAKPLPLEEFRAGLRARSLYDTYDPAAAAPPQAITAAADGTITATAETADINGTSAKLERLEKDARPNIGGWSNSNDTVEWTLRQAKPGTYHVRLEYACPASDAGATFTVRIADQSVSGKVDATGGWTIFTTMDLGSITLQNTPERTLSVVPEKMPGAHVMNLRSIVLEPVK